MSTITARQIRNAQLEAELYYSESRWMYERALAAPEDRRELLLALVVAHQRDAASLAEFARGETNKKRFRSRAYMKHIKTLHNAHILAGHLKGEIE